MISDRREAGLLAIFDALTADEDADELPTPECREHARAIADFLDDPGQELEPEQNPVEPLPAKAMVAPEPGPPAESILEGKARVKAESPAEAVAESKPVLSQAVPGMTQTINVNVVLPERVAVDVASLPTVKKSIKKDLQGNVVEMIEESVR